MTSFAPPLPGGGEPAPTQPPPRASTEATATAAVAPPPGPVPPAPVSVRAIAVQPMALASSPAPAASTSMSASALRSAQRRRKRLLWFSVGFAVGVALCVVTTLLLLPYAMEALLDYLQTIDAANPWNVVLFVALTVVAVNPFVLGYAFVLVGCGWVFGWWGFPIAYLGSATGGVLWFAVTRALCRWRRVTTSDVARYFGAYRLHFRAVELAINQNDFRATALLQLTFLPFGLLNSLLAATDVRFGALAAACCVSRVKVVTYIWLATSVRELVDVWSRADYSVQDVAGLCVSAAASVLATLFIGVTAKRVAPQVFAAADPPAPVTHSNASSRPTTAASRSLPPQNFVMHTAVTTAAAFGAHPLSQRALRAAAAVRSPPSQLSGVDASSGTAGVSAGAGAERPRRARAVPAPGGGSSHAVPFPEVGRLVPRAGAGGGASVESSPFGSALPTHGHSRTHTHSQLFSAPFHALPQPYHPSQFAPAHPMTAGPYGSAYGYSYGPGYGCAPVPAAAGATNVHPTASDGSQSVPFVASALAPLPGGPAHRYALSSVSAAPEPSFASGAGASTGPGRVDAAGAGVHSQSHPLGGVPGLISQSHSGSGAASAGTGTGTGTGTTGGSSAATARSSARPMASSGLSQAHAEKLSASLRRTANLGIGGGKPTDFAYPTLPAAPPPGTIVIGSMHPAVVAAPVPPAPAPSPATAAQPVAPAAAMEVGGNLNPTTARGGELLLLPPLHPADPDVASARSGAGSSRSGGSTPSAAAGRTQPASTSVSASTTARGLALQALAPLASQTALPPPPPSSSASQPASEPDTPFGGGSTASVSGAASPQRTSTVGTPVRAPIPQPNEQSALLPLQPQSQLPPLWRSAKLHASPQRSDSKPSGVVDGAQSTPPFGPAVPLPPSAAAPDIPGVAATNDTSSAVVHGVAGHSGAVLAATDSAGHRAVSPAVGTSSTE